MLPLFGSSSNGGCILRGKGQSVSARVVRDVWCRQVALCGAVVWALLSCVTEGFFRLAFRNSYEFLLTSERWGSAWTAFGLSICFFTNRRRISGVHVLVGTALWITTVSEIVMACSKTLVVTDPVTNRRVQVMRWVEWTVLAFMLTFTAVILEDGERAAMLEATWQATSTFCFVLMPFAIEEASWSLLLIISICFFSPIFVRIFQSSRRRKRLLLLCSLACVRGLFFLAFFIEWGAGGSWSFVFQCALTLSLLTLYSTKLANDETMDRNNRDLAKYREMLGTLWVSPRDALGVSTVKDGKCRTLFSPSLIEIVGGNVEKNVLESEEEAEDDQLAAFMVDACTSQESPVRVEFKVIAPSSQPSRVADDAPVVHMRCCDDEDRISYSPGAIRRGARRLKLADLIVGSWNVGRFRTRVWLQFGDLEVLARFVVCEEEEMMVIVVRRKSLLQQQQLQAFSLAQLSSSTEWREDVTKTIIEALSGDVLEDEEVALIVRDGEDGSEGEGRWSWDQVPLFKNVEHRRFAASLLDGGYVPQETETDLDFLQRHATKATARVDATLVATIHGCVRSKVSKTLVEVDDHVLKVQIISSAARPGHDEIYRFENGASPPNFDPSQSWIIAECSKLLNGSSSVQFGKEYTVFQLTCPVVRPPEKRKRWTLRGYRAWGIAVDESAVERHVVANIFERAGIHPDRILLFDDLNAIAEHVRSSRSDDRHVVVVSREDGVELVEDAVGPEFSQNVLTIVRTSINNEKESTTTLDRDAATSDAVNNTLRTLWEERFLNQPLAHRRLSEEKDEFEEDDDEEEEEEREDDDDDETSSPRHLQLVRLLSTSSSSSSSFRSISSPSSGKKGAKQRPRSIKLVQPISKYEEELKTFKEHDMIGTPVHSDASGSTTKGQFAKIHLDA